MSEVRSWEAALDKEFPCREQQIRALLTLYSTSEEFLNAPSMLVVHGPEGTGKTRIVRRVLELVETDLRALKQKTKKGHPQPKNGTVTEANKSNGVSASAVEGSEVTARKRKRMGDDEGDTVDRTGTGATSIPAPAPPVPLSAALDGLSLAGGVADLAPFPPRAIGYVSRPGRRRVHAVVNCRECVTGRQMFEEATRRTREAIGQYVPARAGAGMRKADKCDSLAVLLVRMENLLTRIPKGEGRKVDGEGGHEDEEEEEEEGEKDVDDVVPEVVLVLDGIDKQRDGPQTLLPALVRLAERLPKLSILMVMRNASQSQLHAADVPHIFFPPYGKDEMVRIVGLRPLPIFSESELDEMAADEEEDLARRQLKAEIGPGAEDENADPADDGPAGQGRGKGKGKAASQKSGVYTPADAAVDAAWLWPRFCAVVWESVGRAACRDVRSFGRTCAQLWPHFVQPIRDEQFGTRDFSKLVVANKALFGSDAHELRRGIGRFGRVGLEEGVGRKWEESTRNLPYFSKFVLCAAYLASYNPSRTDLTFFVRSAEAGPRRRRKQQQQPQQQAGEAKKGRGRPKKTEGTVSLASVAATKDIPRTLLAPSLFPLERLLAIAAALIDSHFPPSPSVAAAVGGGAAAAAPSSSDLLGIVATLTTLRLLVRSGGASSGAFTTASGAPVTGAGRGGGAAGGLTVGGGAGVNGNADLLDPNAKWRVNYGWELASATGRSVGIEMRDYLAEEV